MKKTTLVRHGRALLILLALSPAVTAQAATLQDFSYLVDRARPAVVNISTTAPSGKEAGALPPELEDSPFGQWYRHFYHDGKGQQSYVTRSLGSGFVISPDGFILTNYHVVEAAREIVVKMADRRQFPARIVGRDPYSDLALLKVNADSLPTLTPGDVSRLKVGQWVVAIGSPFGFEHSVTKGIVSAKQRSLSSEQYVPFIQTDVPINPGSSGGPLFNLRGEVVGINSQIFTKNGGWMGVSFAIPIDVAMGVADQLKRSGKVRRGWLGVVVQEVNRGLAESFGMDRPSGALVAKVTETSPAAAAGLRVGDIILKLGDREINESGELPPLVGGLRPGETLNLKVLRQGRVIALRAVIGELDSGQNIAQAPPRPPQQGDILGMAITDIDARTRQRLGATDPGGVLIREISPGPAFDAGVRKGDVLRMLGNAHVHNAAQFRQLSQGLRPNTSLPILIERRGAPLFLALRVPE